MSSNKAISHESGVKKRALIHHFLCAYVGLSSDFKRSNGDRICPKCQRALIQKNNDWNVVGTFPPKNYSPKAATDS
ncbi:hypothetical protein [Orrella daihaiensis]|uniref:Thaumarchaeal output domain-containing protein n=1 Tax=Orrella daihaiensis TaxID=2782176 RepID=A0ABY4AI61_9BURK|nr:hypothetical protein DHf2319_11150 [Orrella daihaiensis]